MIINTKQNNKGTKIGDKYRCYSPILHKHLQKEGFLCLENGFNSNSKRCYWVYRMTNALSRELTLWKSNK